MTTPSSQPETTKADVMALVIQLLKPMEVAGTLPASVFAPYAAIEAALTRVYEERDALRQALRRYGAHDAANCDFGRIFWSDAKNDYYTGECTCGYDEIGPDKVAEAARRFLRRHGIEVKR